MNWERVWIIGNGPSAMKFDMSRLSGESVLVLNKALFRYPQADGFFTLDRDFVYKNFEEIVKFKGEKFLALPNRNLTVEGIEFYDWDYQYGLCEKPGVLSTGCNSGYAAINLAYQKNAREIHLVGYDMDPKDYSQYKFWIPLFDTMLPQLELRGIKVINHNVDSFITAFERSV